VGRPAALSATGNRGLRWFNGDRAMGIIEPVGAWGGGPACNLRWSLRVGLPVRVDRNSGGELLDGVWTQDPK
jgi:hypothetical protein